MIDKDKIPEPVYSELIDLLGYEETEKYVEKVGYNFRALNHKIISERYKQKYGKRFWIYFWAILIILVTVFIILRFNLII